MKPHPRRVPSKRWLFVVVVLLFLLWACVFYAYHPVKRGLGGPSLPSTPSSHTARIRAFALSLVNPPAAANPWRGSFIRGRLDWHDMVPNTHRVGAKGEAAAEALSRHLREEAKTTLLSLLQGSWGVYSLRARRGGGGVRGHRLPRSTPQGELVGALEAVARAKGVPLLEVLMDREEVAMSALTLGMVEDDISEEREVRVGGGPLTALEACPIVRDTCLLHATLLACTSNSLCGWCPASSTCLTRGGGGGVGCTPTPGAPRGHPVGDLTLSQGSLVEAWGGDHLHNLSSTTALRDLPGVLLVSALRVPPGPGQVRGGGGGGEGEGGSRCSIRLTDTPITVSISGNSKMAYHWATETLPSWVAQAKGGPGGLGEVDKLVVYEGEWNPLLAQAYIFSGACPRQKEEGVMRLVCSRIGSSSTTKGGGDVPMDAFGQQTQLVAVHAATDTPLVLFSPSTSTPLWEPLPLAVQAGHRLSLHTAREVLSALAQEGGGKEGEEWIQAGGGLPPGVTLGEVKKEAAWLATHGLVLPGGGGDFASLAAAVCLGGEEGEDGGEGGEGEEDLEQGLAEEGKGERGTTPPPLVLILSRLNKRLLLNEPDLVRLVYSLGGIPRVIALEGMPLCTQVRLFRRAKVLLGMHGSGLINSMFMKKGSSLVQVVPYKLSGADSFFEGTAIARGVSYHEIPTHGRDRIIPHGHFLKEPKDTEKVLGQGSGCCGQQTYFSFWINQDVVVDMKEAHRVLQVALGLTKVAS